MPFYTYGCSNCDFEVELYHLMSEDKSGEMCEACENGELVRQITFLAKKPHADNLKPGDTVKQHIKDSKEALEADKDTLKRRMRKHDD